MRNGIRIDSSYMNRLWETLNESYDLVIVDSPGLIDDDYAMNVAEFADMCVYVLNSPKTNISFVNSSLQLLGHSRIKPAGIVLNQVLPTYIDDPRVKRQWERNRWSTVSRFWPWG